MASRNPERPNILFVLTDDQGPWAMRCAGNNDIHTPVLDALAAQGTRLENFFCASPVCSPARASLLTGQVPSAHGVHDYLAGTHVGPDAVDYLTGQLTLTDVLADNGFTLGLSGKWHLGANDRPRRGFVHWYAHEAGGSPYYGAPMYRDGHRLVTKQYLTDALADDAMGFVRDQAVDSTAAPFFLSLNFTAPHSPWTGQHPQEVADLYLDCAFDSCPQEPMHPWTTLSKGRPLGGESDTRAALVGYFAAITAMDQALGRVVNALDDTGLRGSTVILFSSDNGFNAGHHGIWGKGNGTWPLNMYDSSVKVPAIVNQPGRVGAGIVRHELLSAYDMAATILELAGLDPEPMQAGPGRSFAPLLLNDGPGEGEESARWERIVVFDEYGPARMIRTREWKYVHRWPNGPHELYNVLEDPQERRNVIDDPHAQQVRYALAAQLRDWFAEHVREGLDGQRQPIFGAGQRGPVGATNAFGGPSWDGTAGDR